MTLNTGSLPATLQQTRRARRLSQLELSMRLGISQRHVSFVETGRARPSRPLLLAWLTALDAPLVVRNAALLQAGYAPAYSAAPLGDPALAQANAALLELLRAHDPMPALVLDAHWNLLHANRGGQWLAATLMPGAVEMLAGAPLNMLDMLVHPEEKGVGLLLAAAEQHAASMGAGAVILSITNRRIVESARRRGYLERRGNIHFFLRDTAKRTIWPESLGGWWLTRGDGESDATF